MVSTYYWKYREHVERWLSARKTISPYEMIPAFIGSKGKQGIVQESPMARKDRPLSSARDRLGKRSVTLENDKNPPIKPKDQKSSYLLRPAPPQKQQPKYLNFIL